MRMNIMKAIPALNQPAPSVMRLPRLRKRVLILVSGQHAKELGQVLLSRFRHYLNLRKTEGRLVHLLREFRFVLIRDAIPASSDSSSRKTRLTQGRWIRSSRRGGDVLRRGRRFRP
jgi:hypothetical protein